MKRDDDKFDITPNELSELLKDSSEQTDKIHKQIDQDIYGSDRGNQGSKLPDD